MAKFVANLPVLFTGHPSIERFAQAGYTGFHDVEYLFPYDLSTDELASQLHQHNLAQVLFDLPTGNWQEGEWGIACHPGRAKKFQEGACRTIGYAQALDCSQVNCFAGKHPGGYSHEQCHETLAENLRYAVDRLASHGIKLVLETINTKDVPSFLVNDIRQVLNIIHGVNHPNFRYQYDIYHMQVMEGNIAITIKNNLNNVGHIQLVDNPGRHESGTGETNYPWLLNYIDQIGCRGWTGCEYVPPTTTTESLRWLKSKTQFQSLRYLS